MTSPLVRLTYDETLAALCAVMHELTRPRGVYYPAQEKPLRSTLEKLRRRLVADRRFMGPDARKAEETARLLRASGRARHVAPGPAAGRDG